MMMQMKTWLLSLCTAAIAGEIVLFFSPGKRLNTLLAVVVNVFFLTAFLSPLFLLREKGTQLFSFLSPAADVPVQTQELEEKVEEQYRESVERSMEDLLSSRLASIGVEVEKMEFLIHTREDGSIWINQVLLMMDDAQESREEEIESQLQSVLDPQTRVILIYRE